MTRRYLTDAERHALLEWQGPWTQYPQRMLQMRARSWALRDGCADLLRGLKMAEEVQDVEAEMRSDEIQHSVQPLPELEPEVQDDADAKPLEDEV